MCVHYIRGATAWGIQKQAGLYSMSALVTERLCGWRHAEYRCTTVTVKNAIAHVPIHTAHMHTHKQVYNYACSESLWSYYDKSKSCPSVLLCDYVCIINKCSLRPYLLCWGLPMAGLSACSVLICRDVWHYGQYYHIMLNSPCARLLQLTAEYIAAENLHRRGFCLQPQWTQPKDNA